MHIRDICHHISYSAVPHASEDYEYARPDRDMILANETSVTDAASYSFIRPFTPTGDRHIWTDLSSFIHLTPYFLAIDE
jgi:hypothetical protein